MTRDEELDKRALLLFEASLDQPSADRRNWIIAEAAGEPELTARALAFYSRDQVEDGDDSVSLHTGGAIVHFDDDGDHPDHIGHYRVVRLIGRGGMGAVYLGERDAGDFEHEVAIKLVSGVKRSEKLSERLRSERQTLAKLKHPKIAQLYDGGETDHGIPYFIMEYVEGISLGEYLEEQKPSLSDALEIFKGVCEAVQFAHQKLIIHRDLSPSNILVTEDNQAKLIDFGISHTFGEDASPLTSRMTMTRGYAAPERQRGEPATTLGDIFSLGIILRDMLKSTNATSEADLKAVADKASADDPENRYDSVGALLNDLERYQAGYTVNARGNGSGYSLSKFISRRKWSVTAGIAGLAGLIAALATVTILYSRAEDARRLADQRFDEVRSIANTLMFEIYDSVENVSGAFKARELILQTVSDYLNDVRAFDDAPAGLQLELANGFYRLADVQGDFNGASAGDIKSAAENRVIARELFEHAIQRDPDNPATHGDFAVFLTAEANQLLYRDRDSASALSTIAEAETSIERALALSPDKEEFLRAKVATKNVKADIIQYGGDHEAANSLIQSIIEDTDAWMKTHNDSSLLYDQARNYRKLGTNHFDQGELEAALVAFEQSIRLLQDYLENEPDNRNGRHLLMIDHWQRAMIFQRQEKYDPATTEINAGLRIARKLAEADPDNLNGQRELSILSATAAELNAAAGNGDAALEAAEDSLAFFKSSYEKNPSDRGSTMDLVYAESFMGNIHRQIGRAASACIHFQNADDLLAQMERAGPLLAEDEAYREENQSYLADCS